MFEDFAKWLAGWAVDLLSWFLSFFIKSAFWLYDAFLTMFQDLIVNFPVPASWSTADPWAGFSPQVLYLLDKFMIVEVLAIISAGWTIRFMLNRIPFLKI